MEKYNYDKIKDSIYKKTDKYVDNYDWDDMKKRLYDIYTKDIWEKEKPKIKSKEEIWQEQLDQMDITVIEKFLRKKKLERIKKEE